MNAILFKKELLLLTALLAICIGACKKDHKDDPEEPVIIEPVDDQSMPSAAVLDLKILEKTASQIKFELDVAVFRDSKNIEDQLQADNFDIDTLQLIGEKAVFRKDLAQLTTAGAATDYSALMLLDQSGSISTTDPENFRLDAARIFCGNLGNNNNVALWSFANYDYEQLVDFTTDTAKVIAEIEKLKGKELGGTPLYSSQKSAISYVSDHANKSNKALLTFTDGEDTDIFGPGSAAVIELALEKNVRLYNIGLGDVSSTDLLNQSIDSHGAFMYARDARQLISFFGNLGKLLTNTATFYQTQWTITGTEAGALFEDAGEISHALQISFPYGGKITVPFQFNYQ